MKQDIKRSFSLLLVFIFLLTLSPSVFAFDSDALGREVRGEETNIHHETRLAKNVFWSSSSSDYRRENYISYTPNTRVRPIITYGNVLTERDTVSSGARALENNGYRVVGGMNGDFYNTANGLPVGLIITDGQLRSTDAGYYAMGFRSDGTAVMGRPRLSVNADLGYSVYDGSERVEILRTLAAVNKARVSDGGIFLYTYDFNASHSTGNTEAGLDAICTIVSGSLSVGSSVKLRVDNVVETASATRILPSQMVLSVNFRSTEYYVNAIRNLPVGSEITITVTASDTAWNSVEYGLGALYVLVENGAVVSGLPSGAGPRTAVGQRPDGTLIFYTIDGRQSGYSIGATMTQVARRLIELGCVTGLGLDGGGSTTMAVTMPGASKAQTINSPSDRSERAVSNQIYLVADGRPSGIISEFYLNPDSDYVLAGGNVYISVSALDTNYYPMTSPNYQLRASAGTFQGNTLTTPPHQSGEITVTASHGNVTGSTVIHAVTSPDSILIRDSEGNQIESLTAVPGTTVQLGATASYNRTPLQADDSVFSWAVNGNVGSINETGAFTATNPGTGEIVVAVGEYSTTIPVTVSRVGLRELEGFESSIPGIGSFASLTVITGGEERRYGYGVGEFSYDLTAQTTARWRATEPIFYPPGVPYTDLTMWVLGDNSDYSFSLLFRDETLADFSVPLTTLNFSGWRQISVPFPDSDSSLIGFEITRQNSEEDNIISDDRGGVLLPAPELHEGVIYLDQITASYDGITDETPPEVTASLASDGWSVQANVRDGVDGILSRSAISVSYNGRSYEYDYNAHTGQVTVSPPNYGIAQEPCRVTITAQDASGNIASASVDIPPYNNSHKFTDIEGYWAADYIDYLYNNGIAEPYSDGTFRPSRNITRGEFAVMLARGIGLNGADYADVELPYADLNSISISMLPAVKALYAENIMRGTEGRGGRLYLNPDAPLTRAQASAMIGRSQKMGYSSSNLTFSDSKDIPDYAVVYIQIMVARGILGGYEDGAFRPNQNITRGQMAKILYFLA